MHMSVEEIAALYQLGPLTIRRELAGFGIEPNSEGLFDLEELRAALIARTAKELSPEPYPEEHYAAESCLKEMVSGLKWVDVPRRIVCIYFLIRNSRVVYVGQTTDFHARILTHRNHKEFDRVAYVETTKDKLNDLEKLYIDRFIPKRPNGKPVQYYGIGIPC